MDFVAFTDESYITAQRFRSIASFSFPYSCLNEIEAGLSQILDESDVREFKWEKLRSAKYRFCAIRMIDYVLDSVIKHNSRVDVVVWDTHDSRHSIMNRNDDANFERMFFHLLSASMKRRPRSLKWAVFPDEKLGIDWDTINNCLVSVGQRHAGRASLFNDFFSNEYFHVEKLEQVISHENPASQVSDLFAGLSVFSRTHNQSYQSWLRSQSPVQHLFDVDENEQASSNREKTRYEILRHFDSKCKSFKFGVSLATKGYLHTPNPQNPLNFWTYTPQHENDKAPTRDSK